MPMVWHTNAVYGFNPTCWVSLAEQRTRCFWWWKTTFGRRCMPTAGECKLQMSSVSSSLHSWAIRPSGNPPYELAQYEADGIIGTLDKMAEATSVPFFSTPLRSLGQGFDPADGWQYGGWIRVAEFEELIRPISKKRWGWTPEQFAASAWWEIPQYPRYQDRRKDRIKPLLEYGFLDGAMSIFDEMKASKMKENLINTAMSPTHPRLRNHWIPMRLLKLDLTISIIQALSQNLAKFYEEISVPSGLDSVE